MKPILPKGHISILSPLFKYTPANETDIRATFARVRMHLVLEETQKIVPVVRMKGATHDKR